MAEREGVTLLVEMAPTTLVVGPDWLLRVAEGISPERFGAVYDPASMLLEGHVAPGLAVAALGPYLHQVHVKDLAPRKVHGTWQWVRKRPGEGLVPWHEVFDALARARYKGWYVIDHVSAPSSPGRLRGDASAVRRLLLDARTRPQAQA